MGHTKLLCGQNDMWRATLWSQVLLGGLKLLTLERLCPLWGQWLGTQSLVRLCVSGKLRDFRTYGVSMGHRGGGRDVPLKRCRGAGISEVACPGTCLWLTLEIPREGGNPLSLLRWSGSAGWWQWQAGGALQDSPSFGGRKGLVGVDNTSEPAHDLEPCSLLDTLASFCHRTCSWPQRDRSRVGKMGHHQSSPLRGRVGGSDWWEEVNPDPGAVIGMRSLEITKSRVKSLRHRPWLHWWAYLVTFLVFEDTPQIPTEWLSRQLRDIFFWQMGQVSLLSHIFYFCPLNAFTSLQAPAEQSQNDHLLQH